MTIAAGFHFQGGAVICADSEMTHSEALKSNQEKIEFCYNSSVSVTLTGAGDDAFIRMAFSKISRLVTDPRKTVTQFSHVEDIIEKVLVGIYDKNISALPPTQQFDTGLSLLAAISVNGSDTPMLLKTMDTAITPFYGFEPIGTGEPLARYVAKGLHDPTMSLSRAVILASYVVYAAKNNVPKCGGYTSIAVVNSTGVNFDWDYEIAASEAYFHSFDPSVKPLFLACADESTSEADYRQQVERFVEDLDRMREHKKQFPDLNSFPP